MDNIIVSIIIPFYHQVDWLVEAVESVFRQTFTRYEVIVINDGSDEEISEFLSNYGEKIVYRRKVNGGPASARNLGISLARGKYIAFIDSDDTWEPQKLENQVQLMERTDAAWSHTSYSLFSEESNYKPYKLINLSYFKGNIYPWCLVSSPVLTSCVMVKSQFLRENPEICFSEKMRYGQDWFMWINIAKKEPIAVLSESLTNFRIRGTNAALRARIQIKARAQIWKYINSLTNSAKWLENVNFFVRMAFRMCILGNSFIEIFDEGKIGKNKVLEFTSKLLYLIPYCIFQVFHRFYFMQMVKRET
jgi:glycosyltransferase involved in cell wall biosynthesis